MVDILLSEVRFVYGIRSLDLIKIGVAKSIEKRLEDMRSLNPHGCELVFYRKTFAPFVFERKMHELLAHKAVGREWFRGVTAAEIQKAAVTARSSSTKARRAFESSQRARIGKRQANSDLDDNEINSLAP